MNETTTGEKLKALRGNRTLKEVAESIGITPSALCNYESGIRVPRDEVKIRLANYYKKSVSSIFFS
jgi:transcriptional regulator with XRE-family HTH domain